MPSSAPRPTFQDVNDWPELNHDAATKLVMEALYFIHNGLPAETSLDQTARLLSLRLRGHVSPTVLQEACDLWLLAHRISQGADLVFLLDVPNTEANRARELSVANGNLMASINDILTSAGVAK